MGHLPKQASVWRLKAPALALDLTALKVGPAGAAFPPFVLARVSPDTAPTPKARLSPASQSPRVMGQRRFDPGAGVLSWEQSGRHDAHHFCKCAVPPMARHCAGLKVAISPCVAVCLEGHQDTICAARARTPHESKRHTADRLARPVF